MHYPEQWDSECKDKYAIEAARITKLEMDNAMKKYIKAIPVNEDQGYSYKDLSKLVCLTAADK